MCHSPHIVAYPPSVSVFRVCISLYADIFLFAFLTYLITQKDGSPSPSKAYSTENYLKITEEQLKAASASQQQSASPSESQSEAQTVSQG